ncbi:MAG: primosomal protein N' [Rhodospirillaceae bacterium]|nr:MAG: primosomal protein N' [Rhodospirillaceae bacterium]
MPADTADAAPTYPPGAQVAVLLPLPVDVYDYRVPEDVTLAAGDIVEVPLGRRFETGVVWGAGTSDVPAGKLRDIVHRLDVPPLNEPLRQFVAWVANYTLQPVGAVLRMALNPARGGQAINRVSVIVPSGRSCAEVGVKSTPARDKLVATAGRGAFSTAAALARAAGVGAGGVSDLLKAGVLTTVSQAATSMFARPDITHALPRLEPAQTAATRALAEKVGGGFSVTLLDGVTGSGKTEVYLEAIAAALARGKQVLVLVPEIALTAQSLARFVGRFGVRPAEWHSDLSGKVRRATWHDVATGDAAVVVGARSALFLPFRDLGLIVVDEEHEAAFKQEDGVIYHARDMAVVRARLSQIPIVLASATPSLETVINVRNKRFQRVHLPERYGAAALPPIGLIDMRAHPPEKGPWGRSWLAPPLVEAVNQTLAAGEQALLYLNRRGYAPVTICRTCGHRLHCPNCTAWLVEHKLSRRLMCHHCGYGAKLPETCPSCSATDSFVPCGPGIERIAEEAMARWPHARIRAVASDTLDRPSAVAELIDDILAHRIDLLVGTQILAKGHHFPQLTLVGVVDADLGLSGWDLRAAERTYQMLHQVAGRAGRAEKPGRAMLQTHDPNNVVMRALAKGDTESFIAQEIESRQLLSMPPFGRLVAVILSGPDLVAVTAVGKQLAAAAPTGDDIEVLGPAPAVLAVLRGRHRHRLLLKTGRDIRPQPIVADWLARVRIPASVRVQIDVDPYSFM